VKHRLGLGHTFPMPSQRDRDTERRVTIERYHQLKDREDDFVLAKSASTTPEDRRQLDSEMYEFRKAHREEDIARGKRSPGFGVLMHQIMWARWCEVMVEHELAARTAYARIIQGDHTALVDELRQSLVAVASAASTIEAMYEDVRFLIPERPAKPATYLRVSDLLTTAFGLDVSQRTQLVEDLKWLFERRNEGVHPYAEPEAPQVHPSGLNTSAEASRFNATESRRAVDIAMQVLRFAQSPPNPYNRWIRRWLAERADYHAQVVTPLRTRRDTVVANAPDRVGPGAVIIHWIRDACVSVWQQVRRT
jgi:hypothetical protein